MPKTILITGTSGFIGSNLVKYILENTDYKIIAVDRKPKPLMGQAEGIRVRHYFLDIKNASELNTITDNFEYVIHLAAEKDVSSSYFDIEPYIISNVLGTSRLLDWLRTKKFEKMINFSTAAVLGANKGMLTHEQCLYDPVSPYGGSKAAQEIVCTAYANAFQLPIVNVRIDTPFGPGQPEKNLVPLMIGNILKGNPIRFYGKDIPFSSNFCSRNWIYVDTISASLLTILENTEDKTLYHLLGNNFNIPFIFGMIKQVLDPSYANFEWYLVDENSHTSDQHLHYSLSTIYQEDKLGEVTKQEFEEQIAKTVAWYKKHLKAI